MSSWLLLNLMTDAYRDEVPVFNESLKPLLKQDFDYLSHDYSVVIVAPPAEVPVESDTDINNNSYETSKRDELCKAWLASNGNVKEFYKQQRYFKSDLLSWIPYLLPRDMFQSIAHPGREAPIVDHKYIFNLSDCAALSKEKGAD